MSKTKFMRECVAMADDILHSEVGGSLSIAQNIGDEPTAEKILRGYYSSCITEDYIQGMLDVLFCRR